jgi:hypothetical protein
MPLGTLSRMGLIIIVAITMSCNTGTGLKGSAEKESSSSDPKPENKKITSDNSDSKADETEEDDDDLSVIPPEVVSAAYLTCSTSDTNTSTKEEEVHLGCNITEKDGNRLEVDPEKFKWDIKSKDGKEIEHEKIESVDKRYHRIFGIAKSDYDRGVDPTAAVEVSDGSIIVVKKRGVVKINGNEKE